MQNNPFDIPGMGFNQDNPLFSNMNMMRKMWEDMAANPLGLPTSATTMPTPEDLDKRINELRAVENWLRLNVSMLSSTIQGLEIQRSTFATLQSFAQGGLAAMPGLAEAMTQATMHSMGQSINKTADTSQASPTVELSEDSDTAKQSEESQSAGAESLAQAGQAWWGLMQQQFDALAEATTQSMQQVQSVAENLSTATGAMPSADTTFGKKTARKNSAKKSATEKPTRTTKAATAAKPAAKKTTKSVAKKATKNPTPTTK